MCLSNLRDAGDGLKVGQGYCLGEMGKVYPFGFGNINACINPITFIQQASLYCRCPRYQIVRLLECGKIVRIWPTVPGGLEYNVRSSEVMNNKVRDDIIEWISKPENNGHMETLKLIKETSESEDWYATLTESEKQSIERGQKDHREGKTLTSEALWKKHA